MEGRELSFVKKWDWAARERAVTRAAIQALESTLLGLENFSEV